MKVDISHPSAINRNYHLTLQPESGNDQILLHFLRSDIGSPFDINADGDVVVVIPEKEIITRPPASYVVTSEQVKQRHVTPAGKKAIRKAQKKRWAKFKKLGKTPICKKKTVKKVSKKALQFKKRRKIVSSFWARMTPAQRRAEMRRRRTVGEARKQEYKYEMQRRAAKRVQNKQARLNPTPDTTATNVPMGVTA